MGGLYRESKMLTKAPISRPILLYGYSFAGTARISQNAHNGPVRPTDTCRSQVEDPSKIESDAWGPAAAALIAAVPVEPVLQYRQRVNATGEGHYIKEEWAL
jgi:hypothetical protein